MEKIKIFVYDTLCLGFPDSITYLKDQEFNFPAHTGPGFALFFTGNVYLIKEPYFHQGAFGEIWTVSVEVLNKIHKRMEGMKFDRAEINVFQTDSKDPIKVQTWTMNKEKLAARRLKHYLIRCYRDMSPALSGKAYSPPKTCC